MQEFLKSGTLAIIKRKARGNLGYGIARKAVDMQKLIIEADEIRTIEGRSFEKFGAAFDCCELDEKLAKRCNRRQGNYVTVQTFVDTDTVKALVYALRKFIKRGKKALIVGMGNGDVVADALGRRVVECLKTKELSGGRLSVFAPDVGALTNLDSARLVGAVAREFRPDYVIAVDALATARSERLGACYQFTDSALKPGGGVGRGYMIDSDAVGTRFIAIGVPFIISAGDLGSGTAKGHFVPYDADEKVRISAGNIASALAECFL